MSVWREKAQRDRACEKSTQGQREEEADTHETESRLKERGIQQKEAIDKMIRRIQYVS